MSLAGKVLVMAMRVTSSAGRPAAWQAALIRARTWASEAATWLARSRPGPCSPALADLASLAGLAGHRVGPVTT